MPKRIVDGEALWRSDKLASINQQSSWMKPEYANLIPLAMANGSFECNARLIWSRVYAYNRQEITVEMVEQILVEFERVGLLFRWLADGKPWAFWVGINKQGRLPPPTRQGRHEAIGKIPPEKELSDFSGSGKPVASQTEADGYLGLGIGLGSGTGSGSGGAPELIARIREIGSWRDGAAVSAEHELVERLAAGDDPAELFKAMCRIHVWTARGVYAPKLAEVIRRWNEPQELWERKDKSNGNGRKSAREEGFDQARQFIREVESRKAAGSD